MNLSAGIKIFNLLNSNIDNEIYWESITDTQGLTYSELNEGIKKLCQLELIINVKGNSNKQLIKKLSNFYIATQCGGLEEYIETKAKNDKLNHDILESTLRTNKNSRNSNRIAIVIGILTLIALITQIVLDLCLKE